VRVVELAVQRADARGHVQLARDLGVEVFEPRLLPVRLGRLAQREVQVDEPAQREEPPHRLHHILLVDLERLPAARR